MQQYFFCIASILNVLEGMNDCEKKPTGLPVATTVGLIGNKWKLLILRDVLGGPKRFGELRKSLNGISQKVLTDNLRAMEGDGLLTRTVFPEVPPRVEYSLSELGDTMRPDLPRDFRTSENLG
jgi:DNA-binding HxlR family transcriptional regulator